MNNFVIIHLNSGNKYKSTKTGTHHCTDQYRNRKVDKNSMDWVIIILMFSAGILWFFYILKAYRNRNDYNTAIKNKDWQNDLRYNVNHSRVKHCFLALLLILFAFLLVYIKFEKS